MNNLSTHDFKIFKLEQLARDNNKKFKKMQRLIYILKNNIKVHTGKNGGIYYKTGKSKIYI